MNKLKTNHSRMLTKSTHNRGFTLIELMISISILSLLLFTGSYTYSLMSERWNKELGQFAQSAQNGKHLLVLQRLLEGVQTFVVVDEKQKPSFFFIGDQNSLLAVSRSGLFSDDYPEVFRLTTIEKENGKVDLFYQSISTQNFLLTGTNQNIEFTKQLILFSDLDRVSFNYFGWSSFMDKNLERDEKKHKQWFERFSGIDNQIMPEVFNLTLVNSGQELSFSIPLDTSSERWLSPYMGDN